MKTNLKLNPLFLTNFNTSTRRIRWPDPINPVGPTCRSAKTRGSASLPGSKVTGATKMLGILTVCLLGFLLPAKGQDPTMNPYYPLNTNASVGATVSFRLFASTAYPPLTYQWQHEGTNLPAATNFVLVISNVTVAHAGGYMAWVSNASGGFTNTRTATLTVDPTFTQVMAAGALLTDTVGAWNATWVDYDGDGYLDVSVAPGGDYLVPTPLYHNEGNGTFRKITTNAIGYTAVQTYSHVWGDYDNDGKVDLFVPNTWGGGMNDILFHNNGGGSFTRITAGHPVIDGVDSGIGAWSDYDRDGFLDLFVLTYGSCPGLPDMLYRNNGDGSFRKVTAAEGGTLLSELAVNDIAMWADVDNDGWPELSRMSGNACGSEWWINTTNQLYHRGSDGKFSQVDIGEMKKGNVGVTFITWADYDNDGFLDALVTQQKGPLELYRNLAGQGFTNVTANTFPSSLTNCAGYWSGDYDNDGWQDLIVGFWASPAVPAALFRNNGDGTFTRKNLGGLTSGLGWPVWGDYNNDGFLDALVIYNPNVRNSLFRHNGNTNHWLKVKLDGRASNRSGIGAKVRVHATILGTNFWQMREISGQGVGFDNGLLAHFGLGDATNVTTLRIEWPSGIVQELLNVPANQFLTVVECQGYSGVCPSFTGATKDSSGLQLSITEPATNKCYILEASTNLVNWTKLMACTSAGGTRNYTDPRATNYTRRFYRLQVP